MNPSNLHIEALSMDAFLQEVRKAGLPIGATLTLPSTPEDRWALLTPYLGKPLRDIPADLIILFQLEEEAARSPLDFSKAVRKLPLPERMVQDASGGDGFI